MSSLPQVTMTKKNPNFDELRWVIQIRQTLEEEEHEDDNDDMPVCISCVPKALMSIKPESFIPQQVSLGPYHYWRPELFEMGRYKLVAAKKTQKLHAFKFHDLVEECFTKLDSKIRACYHKYLEFNRETLCWIMAVDTSFLLEFLQTCAIKEGKIPMKSISLLSSSRNTRISHLMDISGRKSAHNTILRDIMMLENQIPFFLLRKILEIQYLSLERADELLRLLLICLCREICPFKMIELESNIEIVSEVTEHAHLLDFLYHILVPKLEKQSLETIEVVVEEDDDDDGNEHDQPMNDNQESFGKTSNVKQLLDEAWNLLSKLNRGPIRLVKHFLISKPLKLVLKLPWTIISNVPGFSLLKLPMQKFFFAASAAEKEDIKPENNKLPPLMEEITIPSVRELYKSGVRFLPTKGNIETIQFDVKTVTLYLPTISFDVNTEVILRNLVAYEASFAPGPLIFTRYTEFMNGIIDTGEDAKLLRENGIVLNRLKSDDDVANLWNGMSLSVKLTKVPLIDKVIEDLNKYYSCRWKVKMKKFIKTYVFGSWKFLTFFAAILLLLLMGLQAFCSVYSCARFLNIKGVGVN